MRPISVTPDPIPRTGRARDPETNTSIAPITAIRPPTAIIPSALVLMPVTRFLMAGLATAQPRVQRTTPSYLHVSTPDREASNADLYSFFALPIFLIVHRRNDPIENSQQEYCATENQEPFVTGMISG